MSTRQLTALVTAAGLLLCAGPLRSEPPKQAAEQQLKQLKEENQKLLETQKATLEKLDEVLKDAQQMRGFAHRT